MEKKRKREKIFRKGKYLFIPKEKKNGEEKEENIRRKKIG